MGIREQGRWAARYHEPPRARMAAGHSASEAAHSHALPDATHVRHIDARGRRIARVGCQTAWAHERGDGLSPILQIHPEPAGARWGTRCSLARQSGALNHAVVTRWLLKTPKGLRSPRNPLSFWSGRPDSNRRRPAWEAGILPLNYGRPAPPILLTPPSLRTDDHEVGVHPPT